MWYNWCKVKVKWQRGIIYFGINPVLQAASKNINESQPNKFEF